MTNEDTAIFGCVNRNVKRFVTVDRTQDTPVFRNLLRGKGLATVDSGEICVKISDMDTKQLLKKIDAATALLASIRSELDSGEVDYPPSVAKESAKGICHSCKKQLVDDGKVIRGCHEACHQAMFRDMKDGRTTERSLIARGLIGPKGKSGRKRKRDFSDPTQQAVAAQIDEDGEKAQSSPRRKSAKKT